MPTTSSPVWNAAQAGLVGNAAATAASAQVNQLLTTHPDTLLYQGASILTPNGTGGIPWAYQLSTVDLDQPFTMSGTTIGRVQIPLLAVGDGADLLVSLCADNGSGLPGTVITQARVPASWIAQLGAVSGVPGPSASIAAMQYTNSPLAVAQFNRLHMGPYNSVGWTYPTSGGGGPSTGPCSASFGGYFIQMGGSSGSTYYNNVYTISFNTSGDLLQAVPQPPLPVATDGTSCAVVATDSSGNNTIVFMGGQTASGVYSSAVYTASFDTATGAVSAWTTQTSTPVANNLFGAATYNGYVYMIGGSNPGKATVYYAQVSNGQISSWTATTPLPVAQGLSYAVAANGFLFVFGGFITSNLNTSYCAPINPNGSIGTWMQMGNLPVSVELSNGNVNQPLGDYAILGNGGGSLLMLSVTADGPDIGWQGSNFPSGGLYYANAEAGPGQWIYYGIYTTTYSYLDVTLTPCISVPLPATGLTGGATYHILMQQQGGDLNDYLRMHTDHGMFPGLPTAWSSPRGQYAWTPRDSEFGVPIQIYDQTVTGTPWHTWEDNGARITTLVYATTPDQRLLGLCEATRMGLALNQNQGFESGTSPWTVTGGTLVQSTAESYSGLHAALVTPNGVASQVSITSELLPCLPGQSVSVSGWSWLTSAVTNDLSLSIAWYTVGGSYLSSSGNYVSSGAGAWTQLVNAFTAPTGAYQCAIVAALQGTPATSNLWYLDGLYATYTYTGPQQSTVTQVNYSGTYPNPWPTTGTTILA